MADSKRFIPGGAMVIDVEEAAERKRFIPGGAQVIELAVTAAAPAGGVSALVHGRFSLVDHHGLVA